MKNRILLCLIFISGILAILLVTLLIIPLGAPSVIEWLLRGKSDIYTILDKLMWYYEWSTRPYLVKYYLQSF